MGSNLSLQSISITSMINSIESFFSSQENNSQWSSLTQGSEGVSFIRFISNIMSNLSYRLVTARRENYLSTANLTSSNIGIAVNLGYSVYRGNNQKRTITFTPTQTIVIPPLSILGTYNTDYNIINLEELSFVAGVSQDIMTVVGNVQTSSFTAGTTAVKLFQLYTSGISEDFYLYQNYGTNDQVLLPTSNNIKDMVNDYYLVRTNPYQSVDIMYLNNNTQAKHKYGTETVFTLKYIELADVPSIDFTTEMFQYGNLVNTKIIERYQPFEAISDIKLKAPLNHETQNLIRAKEDFVKNFVEIIPTVIKASYKIITPTYTSVSYLKNDNTVITENEKDKLLGTFDVQEYLGTPSPDIVHPKLANANFDIFFKLTNQYKSISDVDSDITNILNTNYADILNQSIDTFDIEKLFNQLSYVNYSRVGYHVEDRLSSNKYNLGNIIKVNNINYIASDILGISGGIEPLWNIPVGNFDGINLYTETTDNDIIWGVYKRLPNVSGLSLWQANETYKVGDFVYSDNYPHYMFKCVDLVKKSNLVSPDFSHTTIGDYINDGEIVWICKPKTSIDEARQNDTIYRVGSSVLIGNYSYECITYRGNSNSLPGTFELYSYKIINKGSKYFVISGDYRDFFMQSDIIQANVGDIIYTFSVNSVLYNDVSKQTTINLNQSLDNTLAYENITKQNIGTKDGEIFWQILTDITHVKYDWNIFNSFSYTLTTK